MFDNFLIYCQFFLWVTVIVVDQSFSYLLDIIFTTNRSKCSITSAARTWEIQFFREHRLHKIALALPNNYSWIFLGTGSNGWSRNIWWLGICVFSQLIRLLSSSVLLLFLLFFLLTQTSSRIVVLCSFFIFTLIALISYSGRCNQTVSRSFGHYPRDLIGSCFNNIRNILA